MNRDSKAGSMVRAVVLIVDKKTNVVRRMVEGHCLVSDPWTSRTEFPGGLEFESGTVAVTIVAPSFVEMPERWPVVTPETITAHVAKIGMVIADDGRLVCGGCLHVVQEGGTGHAADCVVRLARDWIELPDRVNAR